jgi:hypothetical protein
VQFDSRPVGTLSDPTSFSFVNLTTSPVQDVSASVTDDAFVISHDGCAELVLAAGASCVIEVSFHPAAVNTYQATLDVRISGGQPVTSAFLVGFGL